MKDVLTDAFMSEHTSHPSWKAFAEASHLFPGDDVSQEAFEMIPDAAWDLWVKSATRFASWKEMLQAAATRYYKHLLFRGV